MPIDFTGIAEMFNKKLLLMNKTIIRSFNVLDHWLKKRMNSIKGIEKTSRIFPVVLFEGSALAVWLDSSQRGALRLSPQPSLGESLRRGGRSFIGGISRVGQSIQEERIVPNFLASLNGIVQGIESSIERFLQPEAGMFSPGRVSARDIFGLAGLAYRSIVSSTVQLRNLAGNIRESISLFLGRNDGHGAVLSDTGHSSSGHGLGRSLPEYLDMGGRYILSAVLVLPVLPEYLGLVFNAAWIRGRVLIIDYFQGIERRVFQLRRIIINIFSNDLPDFVTKALNFLSIVRIAVMSNLRFFIRFGLLYAGELLVNINRFCIELTRYMNYWVRLLEAFRQVLEAVMNYDFMPIIVSALGLPGGLIGRIGTMPRLTLGDLLDGAGHAVRIGLRDTIANFLNLLRLSVRLLPSTVGANIMRKLDLALEVVNQLFQRPAPYPAETAGFNLPTRFPNIFEALFGSGSPDFGRALTRMAAGIVQDVRGILDAGAGFLHAIGVHFQAASRRSARLGSPERYMAIAARAQSTASLLFEGQTRELRGSLSRRQGGFEDAFVSWLSMGGFQVIGSSIPLYIEEMTRFWRAGLNQGSELTMEITPTSPHIIARRVRLGRVRMERLLIRAEGRRLDDSLLEDLTNEFKGAVENAYNGGLGIIKQAGSSAG